MTEELFNVVQFFPDGMYEYTDRNVDVSTAVDRALALSQTVGAKIGTTERVIITDSGDCTVFEWQFGKGITFPPRS